MSFEMDLEKAKIEILTFFQKNKLKIVFIGVFFFVTMFAFLIYKRSEYMQMLESSNQLLDYISMDNENFIKNDHKYGYKIIKEILIMRKSPNKVAFDNFAAMDGFVFKNLFYFAKKLYFDEDLDDYFSYYECDKHPWSVLLLSCAIFHGKKDANIVKNKPAYLINYLIGIGNKC